MLLCSIWILSKRQIFQKKKKICLKNSFFFFFLGYNRRHGIGKIQSDSLEKIMGGEKLT
jgi:hypothetical protein